MNYAKPASKTPSILKIDSHLAGLCLVQIRTPLLIFDSQQNCVVWANQTARALWGIAENEDLQLAAVQQHFPIHIWQAISFHKKQHRLTASLQIHADDPISWVQCRYSRLPLGSNQRSGLPTMFLIEVQVAPSIMDEPLPAHRQEPTPFPDPCLDLTRHHQSLAHYHPVLTMLAQGHPVQATLQALLMLVEQQVPGVKSAIALLDLTQTHLLPGVTAQLPPDYWTLWQGDTVQQSQSLWGIVAQGRKPHGIPNLPTATLYPQESRFARQQGLNHGWATPILSSVGDVLGVWVCYSETHAALAEIAQVLTEGTLCLGAIALEKARSGRAIQQAEAKYRSIVENINIGIFQTTPDGHYIHANPALAQIYGYSSPAALIQHLTNTRDQLYVNPQRHHEFTEMLHNSDRVSQFESQVYCQDGSVIWISENTRAVRDEAGTLLYYEGTVEDITARRIAEEQVLHSALYDALTGLPNRACLISRVQQAINRNSEVPYALLFLDLNRFKVINDSFSHTIGDGLLKAVAQRIQTSLASHHIIARLGGDEFAIILDPVANTQGAIQVAEQVLAVFQAPFQIQQHEVFTSASIGIAMGHAHYQHPEEILRDADVAMYQAKRQGHWHYVMFDPQMQVHTWQRLQIENDLRKGLDRDELFVVYQPIIHMGDGRLLGFEALVRWQHPRLGLISPNEFIGVAEETGLIHRLGAWVLEQACAQLHRWRCSDVFMNVNLSLVQLQDAQFIQKLGEICEHTQISPGLLKLEITESCLLNEDQVVSDRLNQIKALGIELCIDDFGTGYSSLSRLHDFPINTLKIDRAFVHEIDTDPHKKALVKTIITLADSLGLQVVAEGIETRAQYQQLQDLGCLLAQGYYFAQPLSAHTASHWTRSHQNHCPLF